MRSAVVIILLMLAQFIVGTAGRGIVHVHASAHEHADHHGIDVHDEHDSHGRGSHLFVLHHEHDDPVGEHSHDTAEKKETSGKARLRLTAPDQVAAISFVLFQTPLAAPTNHAQRVADPVDLRPDLPLTRATKLQL